MKQLTKYKQRGAVLILMFVSIVLIAMSFILGALNNRDPRFQSVIAQQREMQRVKEVLLGFAMNYSMDYGRGPGRLPCPDVSNTAVPTCNAVNMRRLPQTVTLPSGPRIELSNEYAGLDEQYWYAITPAFKTNATVLNTRTAGAFSVDGVTGYAAVLIAPGPVLAGQVRPHNTQASRYLEGSNTAGVAFVTTGTSVDTFNDRVIGITVDEVMSYATIKVAQEIKRVLDIYHPANANTYPADLASFQTALTAGAAGWMGTDGWTGGSFNYFFDSANQVRFQFDSCSIVYQLNFGTASISRTPLTC